MTVIATCHLLGVLETSEKGIGEHVLLPGLKFVESLMGEKCKVHRKKKRIVYKDEFII